MATIGSKVAIAAKGGSAPMDPGMKAKKILLKLLWGTEVDLDLMVFVECKDGSVIGRYTNLLPPRSKETLGDLAVFPFIKHSGDEGVGGNVKDGGNVETVLVGKLDDNVKTITVVALNFDAAKDGTPVPFAPYGAKVEVANEEGDGFTIDLNNTAPGVAAVIAKIVNQGDMGAEIQNCSELYDLDGFFTNVPGAKALQG
ncbi:MAG: hypothetical protein ABIH21_00460 [Patescibacteria group bacterium]